MEAALGVLALLLVAVCVLAWRLAQGPIDLTWLVRREQAFVSVPGARFAFGSADLAWDGFAASNQPLVVRLRDVSLSLPGGGPSLHAAQARVRFAEGALLLGRFTPRSIGLDGAELSLTRDAGGGLRSGLPDQPGPGAPAAWPAALSQLSVSNADVTLHDAALGLDWRAYAVDLDLEHGADGTIAGQAHATLHAGSVQAQLSARAEPAEGLSRVTAALTPVDPASLAALSPGLARLGRLNAPVGVNLQARLDAVLRPLDGRADLTAGSGAVSMGQGALRMAGGAATLSATRSELRLDSLRLALAPAAAPPGASPAGPVITAQGRAIRADGRIHADAEVDVDLVPMSDLSQYWPAGTGGGARDWLTRNITAGTARKIHVSAGFDAPPDLSDVALSSLAGGMALDDATVWWLRPMPPMVHADARVAVEGPDALRITVQGARQDRLALLPGSFIRITGLQARDQFGDIEASLAGPAADAFSLLNHPRLKLLSRGGVQIVDPAGTLRAHLTMRVPLDDRATMDDIPVTATADLTGLHLGRLVAGRDLDRANLSARVTGAGLTIAGQGHVAGIPARLGFDMDFRNGPASQVLQHLTADGAATPDQLLAAGLPAAAVHVLSGGSAALRVDYTSRRDATAVLQVDADLSQASVATPFGWSKPSGAPSAAGGRVTLQGGRLSAVDNLHAEGPGLAIVSHAVVSPRARTLQLERFDLGRTSAHGQIGFASKAGGPVSVALSGASLDLSAFFGKPDARPAQQEDDKPGLPWSARLDFARVFLAHDTVLAPLHVNAASDGRRILHAFASAGGASPGGSSAGAGLTASIAPGPGSRHVTASAAPAGEALAGLGLAGLSGGTLRLDGGFDDTAPGAPLSGTARLDNFNVRDAPAIGRLLQVMTLYGVADTLHGPGLHFSHLIAPFRWRRRVLRLSNARAFSPSLGLTADGDVDLSNRTADMRGTVVPAYFFNQLLGDLPLVGRLFSPEKGGGVFAARYSVRGPLADPKVGVNPLSALTPGFLRGVFGVFDHRSVGDAGGDHVQ